jgi:hypothetical protein
LAAKTAHLKEKLASEQQRLKLLEKKMLATPDQQISLTRKIHSFTAPAERQIIRLPPLRRRSDHVGQGLCSSAQASRELLSGWCT